MVSHNEFMLTQKLISLLALPRATSLIFRSQFSPLCNIGSSICTERLLAITHNRWHCSHKVWHNRWQGGGVDIHDLSVWSAHRICGHWPGLSRPQTPECGRCCQGIALLNSIILCGWDEWPNEWGENCLCIDGCMYLLLINHNKCKFIQISDLLKWWTQ